jgi:hypothetical protein
MVLHRQHSIPMRLSLSLAVHRSDLAKSFGDRSRRGYVHPGKPESIGLSAARNLPRDRAEIPNFPAN